MKFVKSANRNSLQLTREGRTAPDRERASSRKFGIQSMDVIQNPPGKWIVRNFELRKFWAGERWSGILYEALAFETKETAEDYLQENREMIEAS